MPGTPPPVQTSANMKLAAVLIVVIMVIAVLGLLLLLLGDDKEKERTGAPDLEMSVVTDKTTYNYQEIANITVTVDNQMNQDFPYGDYGFDFIFINRQDYDSGSFSHTDSSENAESMHSIETLSIAGKDSESITVPWVLDTYNYRGPGEYYFVLRIKEDNENNFYRIIQKEEVLITITD
jgi:hypothetical protein